MTLYIPCHFPLAQVQHMWSACTLMVFICVQYTLASEARREAGGSWQSCNMIFIGCKQSQQSVGMFAAKHIFGRVLSCVLYRSRWKNDLERSGHFCRVCVCTVCEHVHTHMC